MPRGGLVPRGVKRCKRCNFITNLLQKKKKQVKEDIWSDKKCLKVIKLVRYVSRQHI